MRDPQLAETPADVMQAIEWAEAEAEAVKAVATAKTQILA